MLQLVNRQHYPMYFTRKDKNIRKAPTTVVKEGQEHPIEANLITGECELTVCVVERDEIKKGDTILFFNEEHTVTEVVESRPCRGNHPPKVKPLFQDIRTEYTITSPIV